MSRNSALSVLDVGDYWHTRPFSGDVSESTVSPLLYLDLQERIQQALQKRTVIKHELAQSEAQTNSELRSVLQKSQRENQETLAKFIRQLCHIIDHVPQGFRRAAQGLCKKIAAETTPVDSAQKGLFQSWVQEPEISEHDDILPEPETIVSPHLAPLQQALSPETPEGNHPVPSLNTVTIDIGQPHESRTTSPKRLFVKLLDVAKHRGKKWLKRALRPRP